MEYVIFGVGRVGFFEKKRGKIGQVLSELGVRLGLQLTTDYDTRVIRKRNRHGRILLSGLMLCMQCIALHVVRQF